VFRNLTNRRAAAARKHRSTLRFAMSSAGKQK
jgi:hypothetical protein